MFTRRDMLAHFLGAPVALAACRSAPPRVDAVIVGPDDRAGHALRDGPLPTGDLPLEQHDVVVVGAGPAGLVAAGNLVRAGVTRIVVLEADARVGGTSAWGASPVGEYPFGAHYVPVPTSDNPALVRFLRDAGALEPATATPTGREHVLIREPEERLFLHGAWHAGLVPRAGASRQELDQLDRFHQRIEQLATQRTASGGLRFSLPRRACADDEVARGWDAITFSQWLDDEGFTLPRVRWLADYAVRDDYGCRTHQVSAWAGLFYHCARWRPAERDTADFLAWPEGNGRLVKTLLQPLADRVRTGHVVVDVEPGDERSVVTAMTARGPSRFSARRVVVAAPRPLALRMVRPWRQARPAWADAFTFGSWLVVNLQLRSRPAGRGFETAWDNVIMDSPSLGYVVATHQRGAGTGPTTWTWYLPLTDDDPVAARRHLAALSAHDAAELAITDLARAHPDIRDHVVRAEVFRHGHAMVRPVPGLAFGPHRAAAMAPLGNIHFAHSDLGGLALFEESFDQGLRAAREVTGALGLRWTEPV